MAERTYYVCFLKKFNNYFNRIIKGFSTLEEYQNASEDFYLFDKPINWNPKDNVSTELIMNDCPFDADYLLVLDEESNIVSRWFIMETVFTRNKQYKHELRRDVIYDNLKNLFNSPVYVEKGWLKDNDPFIFNPEGMSFNEVKTSETLLKDASKSAWIVGYIAKNAAGTDISISKNINDQVDYFTVSQIATDTGIPEEELNNMFANGGYFCNNFRIVYGWSSSDLIPTVVKYGLQFYSNGNFYDFYSAIVASWNKTLYKLKSIILASEADETATRNAMLAGFNTYKSSVLSSMSEIFGHPYFTSDQYSKLLQYAGKKVLYNGLVCQLKINELGTITESRGPAVYSSYSGFSDAINYAKNQTSFQDAATFHDDGQISIEAAFLRVSFNLSEYPHLNSSLSTKISSTRKKIDNNIFDMFLIPYNKCRFYNTGLNEFTTVENVAQEVASEIARELDAQCYDIQLLPYFPLVNLLPTIAGPIDIHALTEDADYNYITENKNAMSGSITLYKSDMEGPFYPHPDYKLTYKFEWIAYLGTLTDKTGITISVAYNNCGYFEPETTGQLNGFVGARGTVRPGTGHEDDFSITITYSIPAKTVIQSLIIWAEKNSFRTSLKYTLSSIHSGESLKIMSECDKYRLCSPNYQGAFDFNLAKNGGTVKSFFAECTYKPFTPYIKVIPEFALLYGTNFGDARGLICGGDFSLPRIKDAWETFELNNKNYQNIFNRDIQNLDVNQSIDYQRSLITGGLSVATAGAVGAVGGLAATGSPYGAIAGGILGTVGSAIGMKYDIDMLQRQQREAKQYAIDKYNYQLGNIKALPYTITTVGSFTINSKIWPFIEFYTCTEQERDALKKKIQYDSMTVMRIDAFGDYYRINDELHYFKGQLIRNEEIAEDNHIFEAIYTEIAKGVYM